MHILRTYPNLKERPTGGWGRRAKAGGNEVTNTRITENGLHGKELPQSESEALANKFRELQEIPLDVAGVADAFRMFHSAIPFSDRYGGVLQYDTNRGEYAGFAYDNSAETWRRWEYGAGWTVVKSLLPTMANITIGLCAVDAMRSDRNASKAKTEKEYLVRRVKNLGSSLGQSIKMAAALMGVDGWDSQPHLIGLPNGECLDIDGTNAKHPVVTIDASPSDYITKSTGCSPFPPSKLWLDFLAELTGGDADLEDGLQMWFGLAMLPGNPHHKAHILNGDGNTGKSTVLKTVQAAMGDYAGSARASVFTTEKDSHPAELLPFIDKRLVILTELSQGALRSDLLKTVTGGDAISVRGMHQNPRTATPDATLAFSSNELPSIRMVDNAIKRRLLIWPLDHKPANVDTKLQAKLASPEHLGGVLQWLIYGMERAIRYMEAGQELPIPQCVIDATAEYFTEVDYIGQWYDACTAEDGETQASVLYGSYVQWLEKLKRKPLSERAFGLWMSRKSTKRRTRTGNVYPLTLAD